MRLLGFSDFCVLPRQLIFIYLYILYNAYLVLVILFSLPTVDSVYELNAQIMMEL